MRAQELSDLEFRDVSCEPLGIDAAFVLRRLLLFCEPLLMVECQPGDGEEEQDGETYQR